MRWASCRPDLEAGAVGDMVGGDGPPPARIWRRRGWRAAADLEAAGLPGSGGDGGGDGGQWRGWQAAEPGRAAAGAADDNAGGNVAMWRRASGHLDLEAGAGGGGSGRPARVSFFIEFYFFLRFFLFACGRLKRPHTKIAFSHAVALAACENRDLYIRFRACGRANRM